MYSLFDYRRDPFLSRTLCTLQYYTLVKVLDSSGVFGNSVCVPSELMSRPHYLHIDKPRARGKSCQLYNTKNIG